MSRVALIVFAVVLAGLGGLLVLATRSSPEPSTSGDADRPVASASAPVAAPASLDSDERRERNPSAPPPTWKPVTPKEKLLAQVFQTEHPDARSEWTALNRALDESGPVSERWANDAWSRLDEFQRRVGAKEEVTVSGSECRAGGCRTFVTFARPEDFSMEASGDDVTPIMEWPGGMLVSPPMPQDDGRLEQQILLLPPDNPSAY